MKIKSRKEFEDELYLREVGIIKEKSLSYA